MISLRKALPRDASFIAQHAHRMLDFKLPAWRANAKDKMIKADVNHITKALGNNNENDCVFIAQEALNNPIGFIRIVMQQDYYTGALHAHVNDIVVIKEAEGKGVGKLLLQKADDWAKTNNAQWITLNVFENNLHAQNVYAKAGYKIEWIKYLKEV